MLSKVQPKWEKNGVAETLSANYGDCTEDYVCWSLLASLVEVLIVVVVAWLLNLVV